MEISAYEQNSSVSVFQMKLTPLLTLQITLRLTLQGYDNL